MKRSKRRAAPSLARANKRAGALIESLLKEIQRGVDEPALLESPEWERLFGLKQSVVVNVQKLVQALAVLPNEEPDNVTKGKEAQQDDRLTDEEMGMLTEWLAEKNRAD